MNNRPSSPRVYISVLNWNSYEQTIACVRLLQQLAYDNYEIIIVDNASRDGSPEHIRAAFPDLRLIVAEENLGYAAGHQHTVDLALAEGAELIWLVNTDVVFANTEVLSSLVAAYVEYGPAIYGSVLLDGGTPPRVDWSFEAVDELGRQNGGYVIRQGQPIDEWIDRDLAYRVFTVSGASMMIPVTVIRDCGFIKEHFFLYWEEHDYCRHVAQAGYPSYVVPRSRVVHPIQRFDWTGSKVRKVCNYYYHRNYLVFVRDYYGMMHYLKGIVGRTYARLLFRVMMRSLRGLNETDEYWIEYLRYLAVRDSLLGQMGKTLAPEEYLEQ